MVAKCANPSCSKTFRYLHEGTLYRMGICKPNGQGWSEHSEWFWLCDECASKMVVKAEVRKLEEMLLSDKSDLPRSA